MDWLRNLNFIKIKMIIESVQSLWLPPFKGSTFRGAFGNIFKNLVCIKEDKECTTCNFTGNCSYYYIFETPHKDQFAWLATPKLPHPYILEPPLDRRENFLPGEQLSFHLILIGNAIEYLPYFIFVFDEMGRRGGIGKKRREGYGRFRLKEVCEGYVDKNTLIYDGTTKTLVSHPEIISGRKFFSNQDITDIKQVQIQFLTPTRIKHQGEYLYFKKRSEFPVSAFIENLFRRTYLITSAHCERISEPFKLPEIPPIRVIEEKLYWQDWERYSHRQQRRHPLGGFMGEITLEGELTPWMPLLKAGEILHVGSATSFGLGKFVVNKC